MSSDTEKRHLSKIIDQFSKQAVPFAELHIHMDAMDLLLEMSGVRKSDTVLDVACGPGLVACEFARHASHVTGIDITEAMIEKARALGREKNLGNIEWVRGNADPLPFGEGSYSLVITRYSFHHFLDPGSALREMIRVCSPGGRVMAADVCVREENSGLYDAMEKLRDDSHVHALTEPEFTDMFVRSGLKDLKKSGYGLDADVESLLDASSHSPRERERILDMISSDVGVNDIGIDARYEDGRLTFTFPIAVFAGVKAGA
jgi:ubiquinone/menaquinone biosynthesis C-methylase UbiE